MIPIDPLDRLGDAAGRQVDATYSRSGDYKRHPFLRYAETRNGV